MDTNRSGHILGIQLEIEKILLEAQHRWLHPTEIFKILQNYKSFRICPEPADRPPGGSLLIFDKKVLKYYRKDGHNWRKYKDGKTAREAHEKLQVGSVDVLQCYYALGEDNENFRRRCYWMLDKALSHIVLVHYRDVKGNQTNNSQILENVEGSHTRREAADTLSQSEMSNSVSSSMERSPYQNQSPTADTASLSSMHASQYEDAESEIEKILLEAQHRWLRHAEICEILQNYKSFRICPEPADRPPGILYLSSLANSFTQLSANHHIC